MSEPINAEKRSQLSAAKQALLAKRLRGQLTAVNKSENQEQEAVKFPASNCAKSGNAAFAFSVDGYAASLLDWQK